MLRKYEEKDAKLTELRSVRASSQGGAYAFGSRTGRSVTGSPIDTSRRVSSQGTLLKNDTSDTESSHSLAAKPDRSKAASACNLSARSSPHNNKLGMQPLAKLIICLHTVLPTFIL